METKTDIEDENGEWIGWERSDNIGNYSYDYRVEETFVDEPAFIDLDGDGTAGEEDVNVVARKKTWYEEDYDPETSTTSIDTFIEFEVEGEIVGAYSGDGGGYLMVLDGERNATGGLVASDGSAVDLATDFFAVQTWDPANQTALASWKLENPGGSDAEYNLSVFGDVFTNFAMSDVTTGILEDTSAMSDADDLANYEFLGIQMSSSRYGLQFTGDFVMTPTADVYDPMGTFTSGKIFDIAAGNILLVDGTDKLSIDSEAFYAVLDTYNVLPDEEDAGGEETLPVTAMNVVVDADTDELLMNFTASSVTSEMLAGADWSQLSVYDETADSDLILNFAAGGNAVAAVTTGGFAVAVSGIVDTNDFEVSWDSDDDGFWFDMSETPETTDDIVVYTGDEEMEPVSLPVTAMTVVVDADTDELLMNFTASSVTSEMLAGADWSQLSVYDETADSGLILNFAGDGNAVAAATTGGFAVAVSGIVDTNDFEVSWDSDDDGFWFDMSETPETTDDIVAFTGHEALLPVATMTGSYSRDIGQLVLSFTTSEDVSAEELGLFVWDKQLDLADITDVDAVIPIEFVIDTNASYSWVDSTNFRFVVDGLAAENDYVASWDTTGDGFWFDTLGETSDSTDDLVVDFAYIA